MKTFLTTNKGRFSNILFVSKLVIRVQYNYNLTEMTTIYLKITNCFNKKFRSTFDSFVFSVRC